MLRFVLYVDSALPSIELSGVQVWHQHGRGARDALQREWCVQLGWLAGFRLGQELFKLLSPKKDAKAAGVPLRAQPLTGESEVSPFDFATLPMEELAKRFGPMIYRRARAILRNVTTKMRHRLFEF